MFHITLPEASPRPLPFYLAMEEYVARHIDADDCFFLWQVSPTVIFGRNQLIDSEVNLDYCREHGIQTYRRKSGGGCVYADMGNIMLSYITRDERVNFTFNRYINLLALVLCRLGIDAKVTGRNDILIDGRKVSGNAFYHIPGRSIVHGTLLYDINMQHMVGSITPSDTKLVSKGVKSVRQHITLLKDHLSLTIEELKAFIIDQLCKQEISLDSEAVREIERIEQTYHSHDFIYGNNPRYSTVRRGRIDGVGEFEVRMEVKNDVIKDIDIKGDYLLTGDIGAAVETPLKGKPLRREALEQALPSDLSDIIAGLSRDELIRIIL
jgi:lipoic acid synthetase/lipoate-protein ligase A